VAGSCSEQPHRLVALHVAEGVVTAMGSKNMLCCCHSKLFLVLALSYQMVVRPLPETTYTTSSRANFSGRVVFACGNLRDAARAYAFRAHQLDKGGQALTLFPPAEFHGSQIVDEKAFVDGTPVDSIQ